jgi:hemerythrin-like domain-containing protein
MQATAALSSDHRLIERVLDVLDAAAERLERGESVPPALFLDAVRFIAGFADGTHHRKEEGVLFPALAACGLPVEGGPIAMMLHEHERGRAYTAGLREAAQQLAAGHARAAGDVADHARAYAALLRQHIRKEDHVLFPMAERVLPAGQCDEVMAQFAAIDRAQPADGSRAAWTQVVDALERGKVQTNSCPELQK